MLSNPGIFFNKSIAFLPMDCAFLMMGSRKGLIGSIIFCIIAFLALSATFPMAPFTLSMADPNFDFKELPRPATLSNAALAPLETLLYCSPRKFPSLPKLPPEILLRPPPIALRPLFPTSTTFCPNLPRPSPAF